MKEQETNMRGAGIGLALVMLGALGACDRTPTPVVTPAPATAPMPPASAASQ